MKDSTSSCLGIILGLFLSAGTPVYALTAPLLITPQNGEVLQLTAPPNEVTLSWGRVADATGYLLILSGPPEFGDPLEITVPQAGASPITRNVNDLVTGNYSWTVTAFGNHTSATTVPSFFTIQTGPVGGGDLPAPALLLLPDLVVLRGDSGQFHFQWTRVNGAASYRLNISPPDGNALVVSQPGSGSKVLKEVSLTQAQAGEYQWSVNPVDSQMKLGAQSATRRFVFTPIHTEPWDLDESGTPSRGDVFAFTSNWQKGFTVSDLNSDGNTNGGDAALLVESQRFNGLPTPTPVPGFIAPSQIQPLSGATVGTTSVVFEWQALVGAVGYEMNLLDDNPNSDITRVIEQPGSGTVSTTIGFLQPRPRRWRVRAYFGAGLTGPYSPEISFNVAN
jgi:hypothetical protein